jgi:hypothetical protein
MEVPNSVAKTLKSKIWMSDKGYIYQITRTWLMKILEGISIIITCKIK